MKKLNVNWVGIVVTVFALLALGQLLYTTYQQRQAVECQATVNQSILNVLKQRAAISDGDRDAIRDYVDNMSDAESPSQIDKAAQAYDSKAAQLDALRSSFVYPEIEGACQ